MANRNGYSPLSLGYGQGDSYGQEDHYDPYSQQPPPYTISEAPLSPRLASPQGGGLQYTSPSAPPAPSSSSATAAAGAGAGAAWAAGAAGSSSATPRLYPQLHQQPAVIASPRSPPPQPAQSQSPYQHHRQYPQNHHQPKSPYQAIPAQESSYQYQHQQLHRQQQQQRQPQTPQTHLPLGQGAAHFGPAPVASTPLVLARPPTRIEDLKTRPGVVVCPCCHHLVLTETSTENGSCTYIGILALFLAGITSCGCCLFPLCLTSCKDIIHSCPNCQEEVGVYSRARARTIPV
ncbi:MAG: LITAF-like zinc ribbon domain-containing protein [Linnemannia gamsii]|nr:MAG: LITAF-like zinc ribbon domain-containing protein [Linnemannia gamsii]